MVDSGPRASLLCLVFTDLVDSTALKARIGDSAAGELMSAIGELIRENVSWLDRHLGPVAPNAGGPEPTSALVR